MPGDDHGGEQNEDGDLEPERVQGGTRNIRKEIEDENDLEKLQNAGDD